MIPIILCATEKGRAVLFGHVPELPTVGEPVALHDARMILSWTEIGLLGVAAKGPAKGTKITAAVPLVVETVWREIIQCTPEAAVQLSEWPSC